MDKAQLETLKANTDIISVIGDYVSLKKRGKTYVGLCPFHNEKTPSFHVDPTRQTYKCFGCNKGGDVISFVMEIKGLSFIETVTLLSERAGIPIEIRKPGTRGSDNRIFYETNRLAMEFYEKMLFTTQGEAAFKYLTERGLKTETIADFHLGYAPASWDCLVNLLKKNNVPLSSAEKCGLIIERPSGGYYDRFRDRIIFPILDLSSQAIGFGGRILGQGDPKYLNSPESPVFLKRKILYNLNSTKTLIRDHGVFIVEGYMDVISLHNAGIHTSVATLGTALGEDHVRLLSRFADKITLVYDGDNAGKKAMLRSVEPFLSNNIIPSVILLPDGKDPDDIARSGIGLWDELAARSKSLWELIFDESFSGRKTSKLEDQKAIIDELCPMISRVKDAVLRELLAQRLTVRLGVNPDIVQKQIKMVNAPQKPVAAETIKKSPILEDTLLRLMLFDKDAIRIVREMKIVCKFNDNKKLQSVFQYLKEKGAGIMEDIDCPDEIRLSASKIIAQGEFPGDRKKALVDTLSRIKAQSIDVDIQSIQTRLFKADQNNDKISRNSLLKERRDKMLEKRQLRNIVMEVLQRI